MGQGGNAALGRCVALTLGLAHAVTAGGDVDDAASRCKIRLDIKRCVDEGYEWDEVIAWYDYGVEAGMFGIDAPNLKSWMAGCPHLNGPEMERIRAASRRVDEAKAALEAEIEELTKGNKKTAHRPRKGGF